MTKQLDLQSDSQESGLHLVSQKIWGEEGGGIPSTLRVALQLEYELLKKKGH